MVSDCFTSIPCITCCIMATLDHYLIILANTNRGGIQTQASAVAWISRKSSTHFAKINIVMTSGNWPETFLVQWSMERVSTFERQLQFVVILQDWCVQVCIYSVSVRRIPSMWPVVACVDFLKSPHRALISHCSSVQCPFSDRTHARSWTSTTNWYSAVTCSRKKKNNGTILRLI